MNIILSIYLIALSCMPCTDNDAVKDVHNSKEISSTDEQHSHNENKDTCSPFCICNCCGAQILNYFPTVVYSFPEVSTLIKNQLPTYTSIITSNFFGSIWQPPQIV